MENNSMRMFLSMENITKHKDHLKKMRSKLSLINKCYSDYKDMDSYTKKEVEYLRKYILSHELFFNSFKTTSGVCKKIKGYFTSKERLLYDISEMVKNYSFGFLFIYADKKKIPRISYSFDLREPFSLYDPILAIDLFEHVYFADYGFNKDDFVKNALKYLDLDALESKLS